MEIGTLANVASAAAVLVAVLFGSLQIRQMHKTRALFSAAELVHAMQTQEFARSVQLVMKLPENAPPDRVRGDPETAAAVLLLSHVYESLGVLVFHRILPLHLVDDLIGGYVRASWNRLAPTVVARREEVGIFYGEWMQWLAERLEQYPSPGKHAGAHLAHRGWMP
jgi:hypothetical protein